MAGYWHYFKYTVPATGQIDFNKLAHYVDLRISNGLATGTKPTTMTDLATWYGVSTSGGFSMNDFRGKSIDYDREWMDGGNLK